MGERIILSLERLKHSARAHNFGGLVIFGKVFDVAGYQIVGAGSLGTFVKAVVRFVLGDSER